MSINKKDLDMSIHISSAVLGCVYKSLVSSIVHGQLLYIQSVVKFRVLLQCYGCK